MPTTKNENQIGWYQLQQDQTKLQIMAGGLKGNYCQYCLYKDQSIKEIL